jgi:hypothetical protein
MAGPLDSKSGDRIVPESGEQRARKGLAVCLRRLDDGRIRLIFDDVRADSEVWPQLWRSHVFLTHNDYDAERLCSMGLSAEQFAEIGEVLVAYLLAANGLLSQEPGAES